MTDGFFNHGLAGVWALRLRCEAAGPCNPSRLASVARSTVHQVDDRRAVSRLQPFDRLVDRAMTPT